MNHLDAMRARRSVRTFDGSALRAEDREKILRCAEIAENPYAIPITWRLLDGKAHGLSSQVIVGTETYIAGKVRRVPYAEEAFGYSFERIDLLAQTIGVGMTCIAGTMDRGAFEKAMELGEGEVMPCVSPLGYPAEKMSLRESLMRKGVRADSRLSFGELFFDGGSDTPLTPAGAGKLKDALEAVRLAPSAVNKQPWRVILRGDKVHFYEKRTRGFVSADGWDTQKIDMGIALCHFALAAEEGGIKTVFTLDDPGLTSDAEYIASYVVSYEILRIKSASCLREKTRAGRRSIISGEGRQKR